MFQLNFPKLWDLTFGHYFLVFQHNRQLFNGNVVCAAKRQHLANVRPTKTHGSTNVGEEFMLERLLRKLHCHHLTRIFTEECFGLGFSASYD